MIVRILCALGLLIIAFIGPWWLLVPLAMLYAFQYDDAYELFAIAFFLEITYGAGGTRLPFIYILSTAGLLLAFSYLKPRLALT